MSGNAPEQTFLQSNLPKLGPVFDLNFLTKLSTTANIGYYFIDWSKDTYIAKYKGPVVEIVFRDCVTAAAHSEGGLSVP